MNLRHLKLWKRDPKPEAALRSPSSDSGYSDVASHLSNWNSTKSRIASAVTERMRRVESSANHERAPKCALGNTGCHAFLRNLGHSGTNKAVTVEKFLKFVKERDLTSIQNAIRENGYDLESKDNVSTVIQF